MSNVLPKHRAREYETIFILHPTSDTKVIEKVADRCQEVISRLEGKLLRAENWGNRRLAYPVKKNPKGIYIYLRYLGYQTLVHELERNLRMLDTVIKYLTIKVDEDVDPEARPVHEEEISFVPKNEEPEPYVAKTEEKAPEKEPEPDVAKAEEKDNDEPAEQDSADEDSK
jgi:small subunit ribosomal protein S6